MGRFRTKKIDFRIVDQYLKDQKSVSLIANLIGVNRDTLNRAIIERSVKNK